MMPPVLKTGISGNEFLHNCLSAKGNRFPDSKFIQYTYKENKLSFRVISNHWSFPFFISEKNIL